MKLIEFGVKQYKNLYCLFPFVSIAVNINGEVSLCGCTGWQPSTIGNIFDNDLTTLLANNAARRIRASIADGSYLYCNERTCGVINNNQLNCKDNLPSDVVPLIDQSDQWITPKEITLAGDLTCNLSCPSCRQKVIRLEDQQRQKQQNLGRVLAQNLFGRPHNHPLNLTVSTSGEIFASAFLLDFVSAIDIQQFPGVTLSLQTNGLLAPRNWHRLGGCADRINKVTVTVDAARPETYHRLRRGGFWSDLVKSMEFLSAQKNSCTGMKLHTRMVAQQANWREIKEFYEFSCKYQADLVEYVRLTNWGTYGPDFANQDVFDPQHPEYADASAMLNDIAKQPHVWVGGDFHLTK